jgi:hypothetical protein
MFFERQGPQVAGAESGEARGHIVAEKQNARHQFNRRFRHTRRRIHDQEDENGRQNAKGPAHVELAQVEASGGIPFFEQQPRDQQAAQTEKDVHSERAIDGDVGGVGVLRGIETLSYVMGQHQSYRHRAPAVQHRNSSHPSSYR